MSQRDFNNNTGNITDIYNLNNATNLIVSALPTKTDVATSIANNNLNYTTTSGINTLLTNTVNSQVIARDNAVALAITNNNANYTSTLLLNTLINNNIVANNLLYSTTTLTNAAINTAITLNNNSNIAFTNAKIITETSDRNIAITNAITANNLLYTQSANIGVGSQFNSVSVGPNIKLYNGFSTAIGNNSSCSSYSIAIGYNAGLLSNALNTSCCYIGSNTNPVQGSNFTSSVALGSGAVITSSDQIQLGTIATTTNCTNLVSTTLSATNITTNNLISNGTITYNYSSLPLLTSYKVNGFSSSKNNVINITAYDTFYNCSAITLPCGVYYINYYFYINYSSAPVTYWLNYGLGSTTNILDVQANKSYCSSNPSNVYTCANSYCFTSVNGSILYQNVMMNAFDNTIPVANLSNYFTFASKITATRVA